MSDDFSIPHETEGPPSHRNVGDIVVPNEGESLPATVTIGGAIVFKIGGYVMRLSIEGYLPNDSTTHLDNKKLDRFIGSVRQYIQTQI